MTYRDKELGTWNSKCILMVSVILNNETTCGTSFIIWQKQWFKDNYLDYLSSYVHKSLVVQLLRIKIL